MNEGSALLWISLILGLGTIAALSSYVSSKSTTYKRLAKLLLFAQFAVMSFTFLLMVFYFLSSNMAVAYVHEHSRTDYPWYYKLAGAWAGAEGSLLLWTWLISLCTVLFFIDRKSDSTQRAWFRSLTSIVLIIVLEAFIYILIVTDPFLATNPMALVSQNTMNGLGMSPLLQTPLVIIHPPLEFAAYALICIPFAAALTHLLVGKSQWTRLTMQWTRAAWLFLTMAIIIGALWAYSVLGWGGYWAWDPVETSNLLVWLPLTALAHTALWNRRKGQFPHIAPMLASVVFALALFATFETRTGIIVSVHSFTPGGGISMSNDLGARLVSALEIGGSVPLFFTLMVVALLITAALFMFYFMRLRRKEGIASGAAVLVPLAFIAVFLIGALAYLVDAPRMTRIVLDISNAMSFGVGTLGIIILGGILFGVPLLWLIITSPSEEGSNKMSDVIFSDDGMMNVAIGLFILWTLVTLALMILGANALNPEDFESRLPLLLIPVGAILFATLTWRFFTKSWMPYVLLILGFMVLVSYILFSTNYGALYFPLVVVLVFATGLRIYKVWAPGLLSPRIRAATVLMFVSFVLSFLMWSTALTDLGSLLAWIPSSFWLSLLGAFASLIGMILLAYAVSKSDTRIWAASGVLGIALIGFLVGTILSIIGIVILAISVRDVNKRLKKRHTSITSILRGASPQLIHLGVALLVLGYATTTFFDSERQIVARSNIPQSFVGYDFLLSGSEGVDVNGDGNYERIVAHIDVQKSGSHVYTISLDMSYRTEGVNYPHYLSDPVIRSGPLGDLYYIFLGFTAGNQTYSINDQPIANNQPPPKSTSAILTEAIFHVRENPMMISLWGGAWLMAVGIVIRMWSERNLYSREKLEGSVESFEEPSVSKEPVLTGEEDYYQHKLREELDQEENTR